MNTLRSLARRVAPICLPVLLGAVVAVAAPGPARAAGPAPTSIAIEIPSSATIGQEVMVKARLTSNGVPVTSRLLDLLVDGKILRSASVDGNGSALIPIRTGELVRAHQATVTVSFNGGSALAPAAGSAVLNVLPARLTIRTVPALDGVLIHVGTVQETTAGGGVALFSIAKLGSYPITADVAALTTPALRADFVRWGDNVYTPDRDVLIAGDTELDLGLHTAVRGSFRFVNQDGTLIDPSRIKSLTLTSTSGSQLVVTQYVDVWLEAGSAVKRLDALAESPRTWRVLDVEMSGTNVVNRGQQRVDPAPNATWTITVLLFDLHVEGRDALFGTPLGGRLELVYPDNSTRVVGLKGSNGPVDFLQLPRGNYTLRLSGAGLGAPTPIVLSQTQTATIRVITFLDIGLFGAILLAAIAGVLWIGRRDQLLHAARLVGLGWSSARGKGAAGLSSGRQSVVRVITEIGGRSGIWAIRGRLVRHWRVLRAEAATVAVAINHDGKQIGRWLLASPRALLGPGAAPARRSASATSASALSSLIGRDALVAPTVAREGETPANRMVVSPGPKATLGEAQAAPVILHFPVRKTGRISTSAPESEGQPAVEAASAARKPTRISRTRVAPATVAEAASAPPRKATSARKATSTPGSPARRAASAKEAAATKKPRASNKLQSGSRTSAGSSTRTRTGAKTLRPSTRSIASKRPKTPKSTIAPPESIAAAPLQEQAPAPLQEQAPAPLQQAPTPLWDQPPASLEQAPGTAQEQAPEQVPDAPAPRWAEVMARTIDHSAMPPTVPSRSGFREWSQTFPENCPHCGRRVTTNAMYCRSCGELLRVPGRVGDGR